MPIEFLSQKLSSSLAPTPKVDDKYQMRKSANNSKPTLESLLKESRVITGKDLIKRKEDKLKELALFQEAIEFEERHRKPRAD